jgi:hypothetical protein
VYLQQYGETVGKALAASENEWLVCTANNPWEHHLRKDVALTTESFRANKHDFIKITTKIPLQEWDNFENILKERFSEIGSAIAKA